MSYIPVKTNYVRPHVKASFIRPMLCHNNEKESMHRVCDNNLSTFRSPEFPSKEFGSLKNPDLKSIEDTKEKHVNNLSAAHSKLFAEIDKIQTWTTSIESECKKKDKKVDELKKTVESQRRVLIDLQMQNENLSTKLGKEIQQRVTVLEKFYFTKELFSTLRKKVIDLQGQFDACAKLKIALDGCCVENAKAVDDLTRKMDTLSVQYSENIITLNNSLKNERNNNLMLKNLFEQQNLSKEKEHNSLCKIIDNYQDEIKNYAADLDGEKTKVLNLQQEKNNLLEKISQLEQSAEANLQRLEDVEKELQLTMESKLESENKCSLENEKVNNLSKKIEELEELVNEQKNDFDEKCLALKATINSLENSLSETKQNLVECESEKEMLSGTLQKSEKEKGLLENEILAIQKENKELQNKLIIDAKIAEESISVLMTEKKDLERSISILKNDLETALLEKAKFSKICSESDQKLLEITKEYEIAEMKIKELHISEEKLSKALIKIEELESDLSSKSDLLVSKEMKINELTISEGKLNKALSKIKELESDLSSKSDLLVSKEMKIDELTISEEKLNKALIKIKELESDLSSKRDLLVSKDMKIDELTISEEKLNKALIQIGELESDLSSKSDLLVSKEMKIDQLTISEENLNKALIKIEELESNLSSKNDLLVSKEACIEEMNIIKQNYYSAVEKIKGMESVIKQKTELLEEAEKKIMDLTDVLKENNRKIENLEYQNLEMKDSIEKARESVKICLECEMLKDKVKEIDHLKIALMDAEKELNKQKLQTSHITKMLSETEENFDVMRIKKEKEIIKCKDIIQSLQHELKILKVEVGEAEKIKSENEKLHLTVEEIKLQNTGDIQRLKAEIESLKAKENVSNPELAVTKKLPVVPSEKIKPVPKKEIMEPDSSDEVTIIEEEKSEIPMMHKKFSKAINRKVINRPICQSTPLPQLEKRKRTWESESSGSECLEILFDKNAKKVAGITAKNSTPRTPITTKVPMRTPIRLISSINTPVSQDKKRDLLEITDMETPKKGQSKSNTVTIFAVKSTPQNQKIEQSSENVDFFHSKNSAKEVNFITSPWREQTEIKRTPSTPAARKFFKTPLKEREHSVQKPQLQKLWF